MDQTLCREASGEGNDDSYQALLLTAAAEFVVAHLKSAGIHSELTSIAANAAKSHGIVPPIIAVLSEPGYLNRRDVIEQVPLALLFSALHSGLPTPGTTVKMYIMASKLSYTPDFRRGVSFVSARQGVRINLWPIDKSLKH